MILNYGVGEDWESLGLQSVLKEMSPEYSFWTDAEAEAPILRSPDVKNWLTGEDPDAGKDWRQEEKRTTQRMR